MQRLLGKLFGYDVKLILFGNMAKDIQKSLPNSIHFSAIKTLHPYNIGFISDSSVQDFFKPMNLLAKY